MSGGGGGAVPSEDSRLLRTTTSGDHAGRCPGQALTDYYVRRTRRTWATHVNTPGARSAPRKFSGSFDGNRAKTLIKLAISD